MHVGFTLAGAGMGLSHQDTIIRCVSPPPAQEDRPGDGISEARAATSVTIASAAGAATLGTLAAAFVAPTDLGVEQDRLVGDRLVGIVIVLVVLLAATPLLARRAA